MEKRAVVTGAFSNIGSAVAEQLLQRGWAVHTLTNRTPSGDTPITASPLRFEREHLVEQLRGADVFVNTFWVRLPYKGQDFGTAVAQCKLLIDAAIEAGVGRMVHVSVSNAHKGRNLGYYDGKAEVEEHLGESGLSHAIVRPTLVVGPNDVLTGNIAWFLRRFPLFALPRGGTCRLQPITITDTGRVIADAAERTDTFSCDAAGPETMTFAEYVGLVATGCGVKRWMPSAPNGLVLALLTVVGWFLDDIVLTREELLGLQQELLYSSEPTGSESVRQWLLTEGHVLGNRYVNDLDRHFRKDAGRAVGAAAQGAQSLPSTDSE